MMSKEAEQKAEKLRRQRDRKKNKPVFAPASLVENPGCRNNLEGFDCVGGTRNRFHPSEQTLSTPIRMPFSV